MKDLFALSKEQERMWLEWKMSLAPDSYQICLCLRLEGICDISRLKRAILILVNHYPAMRTKFTDQYGSVFQLVMPEERNIHKYFRFIDLSDEFKNYDEKTKDIIIEQKLKGFLVNISPLDYPLIKFICIKYSDYKYIFLACTHHILYDAYSDNLMIQGLSEAYNSEVISTPSDQLKYLQNYLNSDVTATEKEFQNQAKKYWKHYLRGAELHMKLGDQNADAFEDQEYQKIFTLSENITKKIREFVYNNRITLFIFFITVLGVLLRKYTQEKNVVFKYSVNVRPKGYKGLYGFFVNNIPMRLSFDRETNFLSLIADVKKQRKDQQQYQSYSLIDIVQDLREDGQHIDQNSFNVEVAQRAFGCDNLNLEGITGECIDLGEQFAKSDLQFLFGTNNSGIDCAFTFKRRLFSDDLMNNIKNNFLSAIEKLIENPDISIEQLRIIDQNEVERISSYGRSKSEIIFPNNIGILINQAFDLYRSNTAIITDSENISYELLDTLATKVAAFLQSKKMPAKSLIAVMLPKNADLIAVVLGILKANYSYVPISVDSPEDRLQHILNESGARLLFALHPPVANVSIDIVSDLQKDVFSRNDLIFSEPNYDNNLAFVIYTSGSTGKPKGVLCDHRSVINRLSWNWQQYPFDIDAVCCLQSNITFVDSTWDIFGTLLKGKKLVVYDDDTSKDIKAILNSVINHGINRITLIPSLMREVINSEAMKLKFSQSTLRHIELTGESFDFKLVKDIFSIKPDLKVVLDCYGATEATSIIYRDFSKFRTEQCETRILSNTQLYILDESLNMVPLGVIGELYVGGESLSKGYINNPELTVAKFIQNPFDPKSKLYQTGDLARFLCNGSIEILGRSDYQIKIRGFRVELQEIENVIQSLNEIRHAVVVLKGEQGKAQRLVGYIVQREDVDEEQCILKIKAICAHRLPDYMRPTQFVFLKELPINVNGKIDRNSLPEPEERANTDDFEEPKGENEQILAIFWRNILGIQKISRNDNFFLLGGNSILAARLSHKIAEWWHIEIPLRLIFEHPILNQIASALAHYESQQEIVMVPKEYHKSFGLSFSQKRLWIIDKLVGNNALYNISYVMKLKGNIDKKKLRFALQKLIRRHEMLNVVFHEDDNGNVEQEIRSDPIVLQEINLTSNINFEDLTKNESEHIFDLNSEKLFRVILFNISDNEVIVQLVVHHVLADGWSLNVMAHDLIHLYNGDILPEITGHYEGFIQWQNNMLSDSSTERSIRYWCESLKGAPETLKLPFDFVRPDQMKYSGSSLRFNISGELFEKLHQFLINQNVTLFMFMSAAIGSVLHRYSGQNDIVLGTPVANRPDNSFENVVGFFSNTLALRLVFENCESLSGMLKKVKKLILDAYEHQYIPFDYLIDYLKPERRINVNPIFQVMVTVEERDDLPKFKDGIEIEELQPEYSIAKFDLEFEVIKCRNSIEINILYSNELFENETIQGLRNSLINFIKSGLQSSNTQLDSIDMLSEEEYDKIAYSWNDTKKSYDDIPTVYEMIESNAAKNSTAVALVSANKTMTYRSLLSLIDEFSAYLQMMMAKRVAVLADKSVELIALILAIFKTGKIYIPIDPNCPTTRLEYILKDSEADILVVDKDNLSDWDALNLDVLKIKSLNQIIFEMRMQKNSSQNYKTSVRLEDIAYVIYTSGTTGSPKGVLISHKNLAYRIKGLQNLYPITSDDVFLSQASFCFDASFEEWLLPLTISAQVLLARKDELLDGLIQVKGFDRVTVLNFTPTLLQQLLELKQIVIGDNVKCIIVGGDVLNNELINLVYEGNTKQFRLFNTYGPTETTIDATYYEVHKGELNVSIGRPLENTQAFVLNNNMKLNPVKIAGELFIGGSGVSAGYLNKPQLNREKFVESPFESGQVLYKTGDLCRYRSDGSIEYLGRIDNQIKLRGFRIELDEIKRGLISSNLVSDAVVLLKGEDTDKFLAAYVVPRDNLKLKASKELSDVIGKNIEIYSDHDANQLIQNIINKISQTMPSYMIPSKFVLLNRLPLNQNAKLDTNFLQQLELFDSRGINIDDEQLGNLQTRLKEIFQSVLQIEKLTVNDDFFKIGGDSLKAIKLASEISRVFSINFKTSDVFLYKTIDNLISQLLERKKRRQSDLVQLSKYSKNLPSIFMVHPGERGCEVYIDLAQAMSQSFNCYGIDSYNLYNSQRITSLSELARHYLKQIVAENKTNRCCLLGWCFGGQICFEIASIIEQENLYDEVELYLLNTFIFDDYLERLYREEIADIKKKAHLSLEESLTIIEMTMQCERPSKKLERTKIFLFKTGVFEEDSPVMQHVIKMPINNLEKYVTEKSQISVITLSNAIHMTIIFEFERYFVMSHNKLKKEDQ